MSSEVCPFCGKTYKRLKSHLPHCKAAASSKTPPTIQDVAANQTTPSSQLAAASSKTPAKGKKSIQTTTGLQTEKGKKASAVPSEPLQSSSSLSSASPTSAKKKKQNLADQIKTPTLFSPLSPPLSPTTSKPKKQSLRALIEAVKSDHVTKGSLEGTRSASEDLPSDSGLSYRTRGTKTKPEKDSVKDNTSLSLLSADTKPKDAPKKKASKTKTAHQFPLTTNITSDLLHSKVSERPRVRDNFWVDSEGEVEDLSMNKMFLKSGSGHQVRITLQDVKATLGRANTPHQSRKPSILSQIEATDNPSSKIRLDTGLSPVPLPVQNQKHAVSCSATPLTLSDSQHTELQSVKKKASKCKQSALIPLQDDASLQPKPTSVATPLLAAHVSSQVRRATPLPRTVSLNEGLKVGRHMTGLLALSPPLTQLSSPLQFPLVPQNQPVKVDCVEVLQLEVRRRNTENPTEGVLTQRRLGQVRLRELPEWLALRTPSHPRDAVEMVHRGWQWYYRKYIDVKKGGVGGLGMLLAGYCVLSYIWSYPHIKLDRWRKYH